MLSIYDYEDRIHVENEETKKTIIDIINEVDTDKDEKEAIIKMIQSGEVSEEEAKDYFYGCGNSDRLTIGMKLITIASDDTINDIKQYVRK
jgi:hypothetical protein